MFKKFYKFILKIEIKSIWYEFGYKLFKKENKIIPFVISIASIFYLVKNINSIDLRKVELNYLNFLNLMAVFSYVVYIILRSKFWVVLSKGKQGDDKLYLASQIGKFLPGKIGPTYYRTIFFQDSFTNQAKLSFFEVINISFSHIVISILFFLNFKFALIALIIILFLADSKYKILFLTSIFNYFAFLSLAIQFNENLIESTLLVSILIFSAALSLFVNIIPFGLGIREGIFLFLFNFFKLNSNFVELIILSRFISIFIECIIYTTYFIYKKKYYAK